MRRKRERNEEEFRRCRQAYSVVAVEVLLFYRQFAEPGGGIGYTLGTKARRRLSGSSTSLTCTNY
jgi:hypothetical protein